MTRHSADIAGTGKEAPGPGAAGPVVSPWTILISILQGALKAPGHFHLA